MGTPYMSEVKIISWNFAPQGWAFCNGQFLPINQNQALFSLLGTTYGGNGQTTFALPDLRGRASLHQGSGFVEGQAGGQEAHTLTLSEMPTHVHPMSGITQDGTVQIPTGAFLGAAGSQPYHGATNLIAMDPAEITFFGGSQPHENRQPYLVLNFVIALQGVFPSQN